MRKNFRKKAEFPILVLGFLSKKKLGEFRGQFTQLLFSTNDTKTISPSVIHDE
jgi:hypothetical protein